MKITQEQLDRIENQIFNVCLVATNHIWDDRDAYILAVLDALGIDPKGDIRDFRENYRP